MMGMGYPPVREGSGVGMHHPFPLCDEIIARREGEWQQVYFYILHMPGHHLTSITRNSHRAHSMCK